MLGEVARVRGPINLGPVDVGNVCICRSPTITVTIRIHGNPVVTRIVHGHGDAWTGDLICPRNDDCKTPPWM